MIKKILSLLMTACVICTAIHCPPVRAEEQNPYADYQPTEEIPANMIPTGPYKSNARFFGQAGRNCTWVQTDVKGTGEYISAIGGWAEKYVYTVAPVQKHVEGFGGTIVKNKSGNNQEILYPEFMFHEGKSYVVSARLKQNGGEGARFGATITKGREKTTSFTKEYGREGMTLTSEWQDFKGTIKTNDGYDADTSDVHQLTFGFPEGTPADIHMSIDTSKVDAVYLAEEIPYTISNIRTDGNAVAGMNDKLHFQAELLNQIGRTGYLDQSVTWHVLNPDRTQEASGFTVTSDGKGGAEVCVTGTAAPGKYAVVAYSETYNMAKGVEIEVNTEIHSIYVNADTGNDGADGTKEQPLRSVAGAVERIKQLKQQESGKAYNVIFAGGEYYIEDTVKLDAECSGTAEAPVVFKAADGEKVSFSGAKKIALSAAKPLTDKNILKRLYPEVRDKVVAIDLAAQGFDMSGEQRHFTPPGSILYNCEYADVYLGDEEQPLAQWPNGEGNYTNFTAAMSENSFKYTDTAVLSRWTEAKDWWVGGYLIWDYLYTRHFVDGIDLQNKTIQLEKVSGNQYVLGQGTNISKRWKAYNLLEEIDVPGEWYIDKDTMTLYYYKPDTDEDHLEISSLKSEMLTISNAQYISFHDIEFTKSRTTAVSVCDSKSIDFYGCKFLNLSSNAIYMSGTKQAETDKNYWQRQSLDAAYDCTVKNCLFDNVGGMAIRMDGGNVDTLTPGNNVFEHNIVYRCSQKAKNYDAIRVNGCGNIVRNNNISRLPFQAIRTMGNDHQISYNEIYNVDQESDDCGAIYSGRNTLARGVEISYNYLHDLNSVEELPRKFQMGIYWDDLQTGQYAHHNIIRNANIDVYTAGTDNVFEYNTSINIEKSLYFKNGSAAANTSEDSNSFKGYIFDRELYFGKYKNLQTIIENFGDQSLASLAVLRGNLGVNCGTAEDSGNLVTRENNITYSACDDFVDAENQDFRITSDSATQNAASGVLDDQFNIGQIGAGTDQTEIGKDFSLISPIHGEVADTYFMWNHATGATSYRIEVSDTSDFSNVIYHTEVPYNYVQAPELGENGQYYWRVIAVNGSREYNREWTSETGTFCIGEAFEVSDFGMTTDEQEIEFSACVTGNQADGSDANAYIAVYNTDGVLLGANVKNISAIGKEEISIRIPKNEDCFRAVIYVWDQDGKPQINKKQIFITD